MSFVSVTQEFNTSTSLGRLTLHILLSFAQFEREIISERTRDKMSAARRKGQWLGGIPVLGYDVDPHGGRLVVNPAEAERVREIFALSAGCASLAAVQKQVQACGLLTKEWTSRSGKHHGGGGFTSSRLEALLRNVLYRSGLPRRSGLCGRAAGHRGASALGTGAATVPSGTRRRVGHRRKVKALLSGVLYCAQCGERMRSTY
ncbi:MAG: recombinase family protein, partial [Acidobacteriaceae bacterium]|nr:recombinase family protein [Acidobacteriaceae bacterium]